MKIVVTSDIHGNIEALEKVKAQNKDADLFIDAGDSELRAFQLEPFVTVRGNCDYYIKNNYRIDYAMGVNIYTTHGNGLFFNDNYLAKTAKEFGAKIAIHGHTHVPKITTVDGIHILCPGSISYPRGKDGATYAIIEVFSLEDIKFTIIKL